MSPSPSPSPTCSPSPCPRPDDYPLKSGWYQDREVEYFDFGRHTPLEDDNTPQEEDNTPVAEPIYIFIYGFDQNNEPELVEGQHNVVSSRPCQPNSDYSDLWQVVYVTVPEDYGVDSIRSVADIEESEYETTETDMLINCPIVPEDSTIDGDRELEQGWFENQPIFYFNFEENLDAAAPVYMLITGMNQQGNPIPVNGQGLIFSRIPSNNNYTDFWRVYLVTVPQNYTVNTLTSVDDVTASGYPIRINRCLLNLPIENVEPLPSPSPTMSPSPSPSPSPTRSPSPSPG